MKTASAADANRHFSKLLREVAAGETVTITSRGKPVATLSPVGDDLAKAEWEKARRQLFERLEKQPAMNLTWSREDAYDDGEL